MKLVTAVWSENPEYEIAVKSFDPEADGIKLPGSIDEKEWIRRQELDLPSSIGAVVERDGYYLRFNGDSDFDFPKPTGLKISR